MSAAPATLVGPKIRFATEQDVPALVAMGQAFLKESVYVDLIADNPEQMAKLVRELLAAEKGRVLVYEHEGRLLGMLALVVFPHFFSAEAVAHEVVWWVEPTERGGRAGLELLNVAEKLAVEFGAVKMQMGAPNERVGKLYERRGYRKVETLYQRSLT